MYIAQQCFSLSDKGIENAIYDGQAIRGFVSIDQTHRSAPDATTLLKFRRLLKKHNLTRRIFDEINGHPTSIGLMMRKGSIVDVTLVSAPPSTKNRDEKRDPAMHQSKKSKSWFFEGPHRHRYRVGLAHTLVTAGVNISDVMQIHKLLHGDETMMFNDAGYQGADKRPGNAGKVVAWHIAMKRGVRKAMKKNPLGRVERKTGEGQSQRARKRSSIRFMC